MVRKHIPDRIRKEAADWLARNEAEWAGEQPTEFEAWLARDLRHRLAYAEADRAWRDSLVFADTEIGRNRSLARAPFHMRRSTHIAALSIAVLIGVGLLTLRPDGMIPAIGLGTTVEAMTYRTAPGEARTWTLPDGTSLTLSSAALARTRFDAKMRRIDIERGTARIRAARDDGRLLEIHTASLAASTHDAVVEVTAVPGADRMTLLSGHADAAIDGSPSRPLIAGQAISAVSGGGGAVAVSPQGSAALEHPALLGLDGMTVAQAVDHLNRTNRVQIRLASETIGARRLIGAFRTGDPDNFALTLAALDDLEVERNRDQIVLRAR